MSRSLDRTGVPSEPASTRETEELLGNAFDGLDQLGVRWAVLRGRAALGHPGGDVDLLVCADDLDSFEDVVFELGAFMLPRVRVPGSWSRAVLRHPWHRFYVLSDPSSGASAKLDVVTQLVYSRQLKFVSNLERGCLDRRRKDGGVYVLDPSDHFWTVLLHCLLDKEEVTPHRAAELESVVQKVRGPSPGEAFFETLCPPGCSANLALSAVRNRDWHSLADLGGLILRSARSPEAEEPRGPTASGPRQRARRLARLSGQAVPRLNRALRAAAVSAYPVVWRRAGLGVVPRVLDIAEAGSVETTVLALRRRPARCDVLVLTPEEQRASLGDLLRAEQYVQVAGRWHRLSSVGLERVHIVTADQLGLSAESGHRLRGSSVPIAGRVHCRRAVGTGPWLDAGLRRPR